VSVENGEREREGEIKNRRKEKILK
jgi:hypothetical protein